MAMTACNPAAPPRRVTVLGSTGSVGQNTIDLIERHREAYDVEALTARSNVDLLADQAMRLGSRLAVIAEPDLYLPLKNALSGTGIETAAGSQALVEAAERPSDWVMAAIVGAAGLAPTLAAVRRGAIVALANKEALICAGSMLMAEVRASGATLLPVDSEHNAIFQVFDFERRASIERIILTASGGPFRELGVNAMADVTPEQAVAHPNWDMGAKISVDSATLMNKGLEVIEAHHLFGLSADRISVVVHPQSTIHSMVEFIDGTLLAQMSITDMRLAIVYALSYPERWDSALPFLDLFSVKSLEFFPPDADMFPCLRLAREALELGRTYPVVLNAANEVAVDSFLRHEIPFSAIAGIVEETLGRHRPGSALELDAILAEDCEARRVAGETVHSLAGS
jgi:1-deoxy-D-xylulose-5-phosphate reductoisomerase